MHSMLGVNQVLARPGAASCRAQVRSNRAASCHAIGLSRRNALLSSVALVTSSALGSSSSAQPNVDSSALPLVPKVDYAEGLQVSQVIKGCWQLSGGHRGERESDRTGRSTALVDFPEFVKAGINTFDAADHYGPAEDLLGEFREREPVLAGESNMFTKICLFRGNDMAGLDRGIIERAVNVSRKRLRVKSVDLMQFYWGDYNIPRYVDGMKYLGDLQAEGAIKHIGVTNFDVPRLEAMANTGVKIVSNQVQYSLLDRRPELYQVPFAQQYGMHLMPYGVLAGGFLSDKYLGLPVNKVSVNTYSKSKYAQVINQVGGWDWFQSLLQVLHSTAQKHNTSISNVAARWVLQRPMVPAILLGARNASHIEEHREIFTFTLDEADEAAISEVLAKGNAPSSDCYTWERGGAW